MTQPVVLITGATRGIGKALVQKFKENGWKIAGCARTLPTPGQEISSQPRFLEMDSSELLFQCDVSRSQDVKNGIQWVIEKYRKIDVLINNAGLAGTNPMDPNTSDELWHQILNTNLSGTYYFCKYVAPYLQDHSSRIINIASILALTGVPDQIAYCSAKHGVIGLTRSLSQYLAPRRIPVNAVCPGWVKTQMAQERMKEIGITESNLKTDVPLGRWIEPSEVADFVYYLGTSPGGSMITGQALTMDGGVLT
jgi:NAD(P)-dependent dehydrogenase (short-subunit alcohol dehydrogenase family)